MTKIEQAQAFAHEAHDSIKQVRKYTGQPYWVHTDEVARIVAETPNTTEEMVIAAHLHDVLEDVFPILNGWNLERIEATFGGLVGEYVLDLTDAYTEETCPQLNRVERKAKERLRIADTCAASKTIKLADIISNTNDIVAHDPDFARTYLKEINALLPYLREGSELLFKRANDGVIGGYMQLFLNKCKNPLDKLYI